GGALFGVIVAILTVYDEQYKWGILETLNLEHGITGMLGADGFTLLGVAAFTIMGLTLYKVARKK
ncbi:MAG: hypothetical protein Q8L88_00120, partial [Bacteroidota bacterium]|nr:hypothetical protein [Bacteroidota bacterium]